MAVKKGGVAGRLPRWLVEPLWARAGVGMVGEAPKTWLAAELALAVATGASALGRFPARDPGKVIFFGAEDDQPALRARFQALADARGQSLSDAPVFLLDTSELRLDRSDHLDRLRSTVAGEKPRLLVLDPFVRLARIDENSAAEVSTVLGPLRAIQRDFDVAILVAHHMRKSPSAHLGQQLRGSGDFAAWSDSNLYLTRGSDALVLTIEHRGAPAPPPLRLRLEATATPHLAVLDDAATPDAQDALQAAVLDRLAAVTGPLATSMLRSVLKVRKATLLTALEALRARGAITRDDRGWSLASG